jgi:hypothetical protein
MVLTKWGLGVWNGFIWLRVGTSSGLLWTRQCVFVSQQKAGNFISEQLLAFPGLCTMQFGILTKLLCGAESISRRWKTKILHNQFLPCPSQITIHNLSAIQRYGVGIALVNKLNTIFILDLNVRWERRFGFLLFSSGAQGCVVSPSRYFYVWKPDLVIYF